MDTTLDIWTIVNGKPGDKQVCDDCGEPLLATRYTLKKHPTVACCSALCATFLGFFPEGGNYVPRR